MLTNTYSTAITTKQVVRKVLLRTCSIITNKDDLTKVNARIKQVLKENGYQEGIISKIFKGITNNHRWSQSQQQTQATYIQENDIKMSIKLIYIEDTSEKVRLILRSHRVRSPLFTENT